jgi:hypothetical protein
MALERPQTIANYALNIKRNNLPDDFYANYLENINDVSVEDVQRVANKYFQVDNSRIIVVGKGADVLENLEKTGIPIKYYDKYANAVDKPVFSKPLPEGLTAETVIKNYISAIGGEDNLKKINSTLTNANVTIAGAPFKPKAIMKEMSPNKSSMEMMVEGMGTVMKQSFNGEMGYSEQQGRKTPMDEATIASRKSIKGLFKELYMDASSLELQSITTIDGVDAYKIKSTKGEKITFRYYDVNTGYLIRTEETSEAQGQPVTTITDYSNYQSKGDIKIPYTMKVTSGPQVLVFETTDLKINEGVSDADFN